MERVEVAVEHHLDSELAMEHVSLSLSHNPQLGQGSDTGLDVDKHNE